MNIDYSEFTNYSRDEILTKLQQHLSEARYQHCLNVEATAISLAQRYQGDVTRAGLAGLVHDYAKQRSDEEFKQVIVQQHFDPELLAYNNAIWHGIVGAYFIEQELNIHDEQILNAVRRHTVGAPAMSQLDKIVFVADFIEPNRDFPGIKEARQLADEDLDAAVRFEVCHTLTYLIQKQVAIYPGTLLTYNALVPNH